MTPLRDPNLLLAAVLVGVALGSIEFLRPGWILPGVTGATLTMLGIAGLAEHPLNPAAVILLACSVVLAVADAWLHWGGWGAGSGALLAAISIRWLLPSIHLSLVPVGGALLIWVWRLLTIAVQAKANKML